MRFVGLMLSISLFGHLFARLLCMMKIAVKLRHQENMCYDEIGLCAQIVASILGSMDNIMEKTSVLMFIEI